MFNNSVGDVPVVSGAREVVKLLLDGGANVNAKRNDGTPALKLADSNGKTKAALQQESGAH